MLRSVHDCIRSLLHTCMRNSMQGTCITALLTQCISSGNGRMLRICPVVGAFWYRTGSNPMRHGVNPVVGAHASSRLLNHMRH